MILLDANILLEMLLPDRFAKDKVYQWLRQNNEPFYISMITVHLVLHFGLREELGLADMKEFLANYPKVALLPEDYVEAMKLLRDKDHEDALQLAVAERTGCSAIVTLDQRFAHLYDDRLRFIVPE